MNSSLLLRLASLAAATASLAATAHAQSVIYREIFGLANGSPNASMNSYGWLAYSTATAANQTFNGTNFGISGEIGNSATNLANAANLNSGAATPTGSGRTFFGLGGAGGIYLAYTTEFTIDRSAFTPTTFAWDRRNDGSALGVAVQIGGAWYASTTVPNGGGGTAWSTTSVDFGTTSWSSLTLTPTTELSIGASAALPSGNITGFGLYAPSGRGTVASRIDGFTITATPIPEPASISALAGAACLGIVTLRRRGHPARR